MLYLKSPRLTYFIIGHLYLVTLFTNFAHHTPPPTSASGNHQSVLCMYEFGVFVCIPRTNEVIWYLSYSNLFYLA